VPHRRHGGGDGAMLLLLSCCGGGGRGRGRLGDGAALSSCCGEPW
jgi:hypothetical protein